MYTLQFNSNPNGALCCDAFPFIRPISQALYLNAEVQVQVRDYFLGYVKITAIKQVKFYEITDYMAYCIIGHDAGYLRSVLRKMAGNSVMDEAPYAWGIAAWIERNVTTQAQLFERHWDVVRKKSKAYQPDAEAKGHDKADFKTQSHWQGEENYVL